MHKEMLINRQIHELEQLTLKVFRHPDATPEDIDNAVQILIRNPRIPERKL